MVQNQQDEGTRAPPLQDIALRPVRPIGPANGRALVSEGQDAAAYELVKRSAAGTAEVSYRLPLLFVLSFVLPVIVAGVYLFFIASDRYVSEARFIIRSVSPGMMDTTAAVLVPQGLARAGDESYIIDDYITSRDLLSILVKYHNIKDIFSRPEVDLFNRYPFILKSDNEEYLYSYYKRMITAQVDAVTGISTIIVTAYRREDAQILASALLDSAEQLVNVLNQRAQENELNYAGSLVEQSTLQLRAAEGRLSEYRNANGIVDPEGETSAAMKTITSLSTELSKAQINLSMQLALAPNSPAVSRLRESINALTQELTRQKQAMAGDRQSIAAKLGKYEQYVLERDIAARALSSAESNRDRARQDSQKQHLYLQRIVEPNSPDKAAYPRRFIDLGIIILIFGAVYFSIRSIINIVKEHAV